MATNGVSRQSRALQNPGAQLRAGRIAVQRQRAQRASRAGALSLALMGTPQETEESMGESPYQNDPAAALNAERHAARQRLSPEAMMPMYAQNIQDDATNDYGEIDTGLLDEEHAAMMDIADESNAADELSLAQRARSNLRARADAWQDNALKKFGDEMEDLLTKARTDAVSKGASAVDSGNFLEIADTAGTGIAAAQLAVSVLAPALSPQQQKFLGRLGLPPLSMGKGWDIFSITGSFVQLLKWSTIVAVIIPFALVMNMMIAYSACKLSPICLIPITIQNAIGSFLGF